MNAREGGDAFPPSFFLNFITVQMHWNRYRNNVGGRKVTLKGRVVGGI